MASCEVERWLPLATIFLLLWFYRYQHTLPKDMQTDQKIRITATLREEPQVDASFQKFSLAGIRIKADRMPEYHWGDKLVVEGGVRAVSRNRFYQEYYLDRPEIKISSTSRAGSTSRNTRIFRAVFNFKKRIVSSYRTSLPEPHAGLLAGIVLGEKASLPSGFWQSLKKTGTLHIVVASGSNIAFLVSFLMMTLPFLFSRKLSYIVASTLIWFYVVMAGAEAPIFRAGIMGTITYLGLSLGKNKEALRGLLVAGVVLLLARPLSIFNAGFQLSFGATLGIIIFGTRKWGVIEKLSGGLKEALKTTLSAQVFTAPIIFLNFGGLSLLSPLTNILVYWTIPILMIFGGIGGVLSLIWPSAGKLFYFLAYPLLEYFVRIITWLNC